MEQPNKEQVYAAVEILWAVAEAIQSAKEIPSGELYALLMARGMDIDTYQGLIRVLENARFIQTTNHLLVWIGPERTGWRATQ